MKFIETSKIYSLNKSTYVNLRWIAYSGQLITILLVQFFFQYKFDYLLCISIIFISILTNLYLIFKIKENQLNNFFSSIFLTYDIFHLQIVANQLELNFYWLSLKQHPFLQLYIDQNKN